VKNNFHVAIVAKSFPVKIIVRSMKGLIQGKKDSLAAFATKNSPD